MGRYSKERRAEKLASDSPAEQVEAEVNDNEESIMTETEEVTEVEAVETDVPEITRLEAPPAPEYEPEPVFQSQPLVRPELDPFESIAKAMLMMGKVYNDAGLVSEALNTVHIRQCGGEPELHSFLHRMMTLIDEFRNAFAATENSTSERLQKEIADGISASAI